MKVGKEEAQKIVLGVLLGVGVVFGYFQWLLSPLQARHAATKKSVAALDPAISKAKAQIARDNEVRAQAPLAQATLAQIDGMIPEGAPVAWFPPRIGEFFKNHGVEKVITRMNSESAHPTLVGYRRISWSIDLPKVECMNFGATLADLENTEPLIAIESLTMETIREEPDAQHVLLNLVNIVKQ